MAIDTTIFDADLDAMIADIPVDAKFGSTEFTCAASSLSSDETLLLVGNQDNKGVRVLFPVSAFAASATFKPQGHLSLKYPDATAWTSYEIVSINLASDKIAYEVVLKDDPRS